MAADETPQPPEDGGNEDVGEFQDLDEPGRRPPDDADEAPLVGSMPREDPWRVATAVEREQVPFLTLTGAGSSAGRWGLVERPCCQRF